MSVVAEVGAGAKAPLAEIKNHPVKGLVAALVVVSLVVLLEIFMPGVITGKIRRTFNMVGIKGKAA